MAALSAPRNTEQYLGDDFAGPAAADAVIHQGGMVAANALGVFVRASASATLTVVGRAEASVDNTGGDDGDVLVRYRRGCFGWDNDATARVEQAGTLCYVVDDHTVSSDDDEGARPVAGRVVCVLQSGIVVVDHR